MSMSSVPFSTHDLSFLRSAFPNPSSLREAYSQLASWALKAERYEDLARVMKECTRASAQGAIGPPPPPNAALLMSISGGDTIANDASRALSRGFSSPLSSAAPSTVLPPVQAALVQDPHDLSPQERSLLVTAYKHMVCQLRASWRSVHNECTALLLKTQMLQLLGSQPLRGMNGSQHPTQVTPASQRSLKHLPPLISPSDLPPHQAAAYKLIKDYCNQLEREILAVCTDLTTLLDQTLIAVVQHAESKVFYLKLAADFYRYLAEVHLGVTGIAPKHLISLQHRSQPSVIVPNGYDKKAMEYYAAAHKIAFSQLDPCHPTRLGVCCNYAVLLYEIFDEQKQACELAKQSFDMAIARLDEMEGAYKECTLLMQLLRDNITLWNCSEEEAP